MRTYLIYAFGNSDAGNRDDAFQLKYFSKTTIFSCELNLWLQKPGLRPSNLCGNHRIWLSFSVGCWNIAKKNFSSNNWNLFLPKNMMKNCFKVEVSNGSRTKCPTRPSCRKVLHQIFKKYFITFSFYGHFWNIWQFGWKPDSSLPDPSSAIFFNQFGFGSGSGKLGSFSVCLKPENQPV